MCYEDFPRWVDPEISGENDVRYKLTIDCDNHVFEYFVLRSDDIIWSNKYRLAHDKDIDEDIDGEDRTYFLTAKLFHKSSSVTIYPCFD